MIGNTFGNMMSGMGGFGGQGAFQQGGLPGLQTRQFQGNTSMLPWMNKKPLPGLDPEGNAGPSQGGVSMMSMNNPVRLGGGMPQMPQMPQQRNAPQGNPILGSMLPANQQMLPQGQGQKNQFSLQNQLNPMVQKLQQLMPQNFKQNPGLGGLLQNPNTLASLMRSRY